MVTILSEIEINEELKKKLMQFKGQKSTELLKSEITAVIQQYLHRLYVEGPLINGAPDEYDVKVEHPYRGKVTEQGKISGFIVDEFGDLYDPTCFEITIQKKER